MGDVVVCIWGSFSHNRNVICGKTYKIYGVSEVIPLYRMLELEELKGESFSYGRFELNTFDIGL